MILSMNSLRLIKKEPFDYIKEKQLLAQRKIHSYLVVCFRSSDELRFGPFLPPKFRRVYKQLLLSLLPNCIMYHHVQKDLFIPCQKVMTMMCIESLTVEL